MATFRALNAGSRGRGRGRDASRATNLSLVGEGGSGNVAPGSTLAADTEKLYFDSYANLGIHQEMIQDEVRTCAYRDALMRHADRIRGKVVVDVGCGTGILSIFAARAGARKVYAIDASDIAIHAQQVVQANGLSDVITVLHKRVEEVELEERADVLVSEWMGYMLLYETMLPAVIAARDRLLKPGGLILPSHATLFIAPVSCEDRFEDGTAFWSDVHGIDMSALVPLAKKCYFTDPCVENITAEHVLGEPSVVKRIDCATVTEEDLQLVEADFSSKSMIVSPLTGFAFWFSVEFNNHPSPIAAPTLSRPSAASPAPAPAPDAPAAPAAADAEIADAPSEGFVPSGADAATAPASEAAAAADSTAAAATASPGGDSTDAMVTDSVVLSTAPEDTPTHWMQTVLYVGEMYPVHQDDVISGHVTITPNKECTRFLDIGLSY
ncbi:unnamed protein product, partial [Closterium sp. Naga37s-1]